MSEERYAVDERPVPESTLTELFFEAIDRHGSEAALQRMTSATDVVDISYRDVLATVKRVVGGFAAKGLERGDRVAILAENRPEWALTDWGCLCSGVIAVPIYPLLTPSQVSYIMEK